MPLMKSFKIKHTLTELKGEINNSTIIVGDISTPLSMMDRTSKQKIDKSIEDSNNTINHKTEQTSTEYSTQEQNTLSSQVHMEHPPG